MKKEKRNNSFLWIIFFVVLIIIIGSVWFASFRGSTQPEEETTEGENIVNEDFDISNWRTYENEEYGFSFMYPEDWDEINLEEIDGPTGSKIVKSIKIISSGDENKYIQIQIVKLQDKDDSSIVDYPHLFITNNDKYAFFYSSGADCLGMPDCDKGQIKETKHIIDLIIETFKTKN